MDWLTDDELTELPTTDGQGRRLATDIWQCGIPRLHRVAALPMRSAIDEALASPTQVLTKRMGEIAS
ncbi:MAG: hypothetical protein AAF311_13910 [Pseudomonadota bacterium]